MSASDAAILAAFVFGWGLLPLTIGLRTLLALRLFSGMSGWLALLVGAALAPTNAAGRWRDGQPGGAGRIRRLVNVESGLNDGIATPFVLVAVTGAAGLAFGAIGGGGASGWCRSSRRRARWYRCWSDWRSVLSRSSRRCRA